MFVSFTFSKDAKRTLTITPLLNPCPAKELSKKLFRATGTVTFYPGHTEETCVVRRRRGSNTKKLWRCVPWATLLQVFYTFAEREYLQHTIQRITIDLVKRVKERLERGSFWKVWRNLKNYKKRRSDANVADVVCA